MISVHIVHSTFWYHNTTSTAVLLHGTSPQQPKHQYAWTQYYIPFEWLHLKLSAFGCYLTELNSLFPMTQHRTHPWPHTTLYIFTVIAYWCTIHWCLSTSVSPYSFCLIQQYNGDHDVQLKQLKILQILHKCHSRSSYKSILEFDQANIIGCQISELHAYLPKWFNYLVIYS